ncbi:MAG: hypothetical protein A3E83_04205 [Gammaproteobacteria bacterium RIFCSPHIGHO2_12_FULL_41_20]|nr:MAG: hypothetical protein A3E83_04205 [Gammaproteobacteria bacterium RIFCSPHIGHO2_12_FULL_41_20]
MRNLLIIFLLLFSSVLKAEGVPAIALAQVSIDPSDVASIKRGGKFFATNCMSCHTMVYLRYDKIAQEAGVLYDKMPINVASWPFGIRPPDLSLEADVRGDDWIYTYLHSFYQDSTRPTGVNNLLVPNTAMPDIVAPYQGTQVRVTEKGSSALFHAYQWYDLLVLDKQGTMTPEQFDAAMTDLVNFLHYAASPYEQQQHRIGWWVLGFMLILLVMFYFLKKEYWKDVKKHKK